jgi:hypothetical protein
MFMNTSRINAAKIETKEYTYMPLTLYSRRGSIDISDMPLRHSQNYLAIWNTADVTGFKPIAD